MDTTENKRQWHVDTPIGPEIYTADEVKIIDGALVLSQIEVTYGLQTPHLVAALAPGEWKSVVPADL